MNIESFLYSISLAPKLASEIKKYTEHKNQLTGENKIDYVSNTVAHAILGAVVAQLQGNSAIVGGLGAAYGENSARIIAGILYPDKAIDKLSQEEKQQVSALAQLATGLTTAALGGDAQDINTAMAGGKNAIENNYLNSSDHQDKVGLEYKEKKGELTDKEKLKLAELRTKDVLSDDALLEACVDINSDACHVERQKAYDALKTYRHLSYLNPPEDQLGYQEIQHLLESTSNSPEVNQLRVIYNSYVTAYKSFGYDEEDARVMAGATMGAMITLHGVNGTITIPKINKIFGSSKLLAAGKGTNANKPLNKTDLEHQYGKGNVEQGGGNYKETKDNIYDNQVTNQKANESSNFGEHVKNEKDLNNKPLDKDYFESEYGKGNVQQGGGNYKETKDKIHDNQITNQKGNSSSKFDEHIKNEQDINANLGKRPGDKIWSETNKKSPVTNAYDHWDKHKKEFPELQNSKQYVDAAHNFVRHPPEGTLTKVRKNGDTLYYNPSTNIFAIKNADGTPRTMFKPEKGLEYWNKQK